MGLHHILCVKGLEERNENLLPKTMQGICYLTLAGTIFLRIILIYFVFECQNM